MGTRLVGWLRTEAELSKLGLTWNSCHTRANTSSWTNIHYNSIVYTVPHREKELASTSFGHMRGFNTDNSLSRALRLSVVSQVWGRTGLKTRVIISDILSALYENLSENSVDLLHYSETLQLGTILL